MATMLTLQYVLNLLNDIGGAEEASRAVQLEYELAQKREALAVQEAKKVYKYDPYLGKVKEIPLPPGGKVTLSDKTVAMSGVEYERNVKASQRAFIAWQKNLRQASMVKDICRTLGKTTIPDAIYMKVDEGISGESKSALTRPTRPDQIIGKGVFSEQGMQMSYPQSQQVVESQEGRWNWYSEYGDGQQKQPTNGMRAWTKVIEAAAIECKCGKLPIMRLVKAEMGKEDRLCCMCIACKILGPVCSGPRKAVTGWNNKIQGAVVQDGEPEKKEDPKRLRRFDLDA